MSLFKIFSYLHFLSLFPDFSLYKEVKSIIYYLDIYLKCNQYFSWCRILRLLKTVTYSWMTFGNFKYLKFKALQFHIQLKLKISKDVFVPKLLPFQDDLYNIVRHIEVSFSITSNIIKHKFLFSV